MNAQQTLLRAHNHSIGLLSKILIRLDNLETLIMALDPTVQTILDEVKANSDGVAAALAGLAAEATQITALQAQITDLQNQIANGTPINAENLAPLQQAAADLGATNAQLQANVPANVAPAP